MGRATPAAMATSTAPNSDDQDARHHLEGVLVGEEQAADRRGRGAEDGEDHGEPGDEGEDPPEQPAAVTPELLGVRPGPVAVDGPAAAGTGRRRPRHRLGRSAVDRDPAGLAGGADAAGDRGRRAPRVRVRARRSAASSAADSPETIDR